tara:strand:- start:4782 stop:5063 length:282 start_codon:yes stop_codon:yes gene_type:complete
MKMCIHCQEPNTEGWFYCRYCDKPASERKYTVNTILRDTPWASAIRRDLVGVSSISMDEDIKNKAAERHQEMHNKIFPKNAKKSSVKINRPNV